MVLLLFLFFFLVYRIIYPQYLSSIILYSLFIKGVVENQFKIKTKRKILETPLGRYLQICDALEKYAIGFIIETTVGSMFRKIVYHR